MPGPPSVLPMMWGLNSRRMETKKYLLYAWKPTSLSIGFKGVWIIFSQLSGMKTSSVMIAFNSQKQDEHQVGSLVPACFFSANPHGESPESFTTESEKLRTLGHPKIPSNPNCYRKCGFYDWQTIVVQKLWSWIIALVSETNVDSSQIETQRKNLSKLRLESCFSPPIQPKFKPEKFTKLEKELRTSGGTAIITSLPLREFDVGQKDRFYSDKTRVTMSTVKTQSLEILCVSIKPLTTVSQQNKCTKN